MLETFLGAPWPVFVGLTLVLAGGAAVSAGRSVGDNWKPPTLVVLAAFGIALADRFLIFALFGGPLLSVWGFLFHFAILAALSLLSWRAARVARMVRQYPWRYERAGPFAYRARAGA